MRFILISIALFFCASTNALAKPVIVEGIYQVEFGNLSPAVSENTLPGQSGSARQITYTGEDQHALKILNTVSPDGGIQIEDAEIYFNAMIQNLQSGMPELKIISNQTATLGEYSGRELEAGNRDMTMLTRLFATRKGVVFVQAIFLNGSEEGRASAQAFVNSLSITPGNG